LSSLSGLECFLGTPEVSPGVSRVELLLDDAPVWRGYLKITD
jgi:hypothetical protein